jgi:hypothetical protein
MGAAESTRADVNPYKRGWHIAADLRSALLPDRRLRRPPQIRRPLMEGFMESIFVNFLSDQVFGLDGLINLANIALLSAFSVRGVLKLRVLALVSDLMTVRTIIFSTSRFGLRSSGRWHSSSSTGFGLSR